MTSPILPSARPDQPLVSVLIVDDSFEVLYDLRQLLELSGLVRVIGEAHDGQEALAQAERLSPDVVVMDLEMPGMNGVEATRRIKDRRLARRVVILSVHGGSEVMDLVRAAGADNFVAKGAGYKVLLNAILGKDGSVYALTKGDGS
jgi:DNA-binding NarL/FixJ family response regulator